MLCIYLCNVLRFDGREITKAPAATHSHYMTSMGNYQNTAIAIGCWWDENKATEQFKDGKWIDLVSSINNVYQFSSPKIINLRSKIKTNIKIQENGQKYSKKIILNTFVVV